MTVEKYVRDEDVFLASYTDGLTDLDLVSYLNYARERDKTASFLSVKPNLSYHPRANRCWRPGDRNQGVHAIRHPNQCGIFCFEEGNFQIHAARRRTRNSALPTPSPRKGN